MSAEELLAEAMQALKDALHAVPSDSSPVLSALLHSLTLTHEALIAYVTETETRLLKLERASKDDDSQARATNQVPR